MQTGGRFEDAYLQAAASGGRRPVDHAPRIVRSVVAHRGGPSRVRDGAAGADHVHRRVMQRQRETPERHDPRVHQQLQLVAPGPLALEKAERVAGPQAGLAEPKDAAMPAHEAAPPAQALVWPERQSTADPDPVGLACEASSAPSGPSSKGSCSHTSSQGSGSGRGLDSVDSRTSSSPQNARERDVRRV